MLAYLPRCGYQRLRYMSSIVRSGTTHWALLTSLVRDAKLQEQVDALSVDDFGQKFTDVINAAMLASIPRKVLSETRGTHPWLNKRCRDSIDRKRSLENSDDYMQAVLDCTDVLRTEYVAYVQRTRDELLRLREGWKNGGLSLSYCLMQRCL